MGGKLLPSWSIHQPEFKLINHLEPQCCKSPHSLRFPVCTWATSFQAHLYKELVSQSRVLFC